MMLKLDLGPLNLRKNPTSIFKMKMKTSKNLT